MYIFSKFYQFWIFLIYVMYQITVDISEKECQRKVPRRLSLDWDKQHMHWFVVNRTFFMCAGIYVVIQNTKILNSEVICKKKINLVWTSIFKTVYFVKFTFIVNIILQTARLAFLE